MPDEVPAETPPHWLAYFWLDDVDAGFERVQELGGELLREPTTRRTAATPRCADPQGRRHDDDEGPARRGPRTAVVALRRSRARRRRGASP